MSLQYAGSSGCSNCTSPTFNAEWYNAFGVTLCNTCRRAEELIAKGSAQQRYLLTDSDFRKLGFLTKSNPQHKDWTPMRLYLVSQVQALSYQRHGGPDGLEQALYHRVNRAMDQRTKARQEARRKATEETAKIARAKRKMEEMEASRGTRIRHDATRGAVRREGGQAVCVFEDGVEVEVEEL